METKEVKLISGATLNITLASFSEGHNLFKSFSKELEQANLDPNGDLFNPLAIKNLFCRLSWSDEFQNCLWECMKRATYNKEKITPDLFEDAKKREDFIEVCTEVGAFNLAPFMKSLYAKYLPTLSMIKDSLG